MLWITELSLLRYSWFKLSHFLHITAANWYLGMVKLCYALWVFIQVQERKNDTCMCVHNYLKKV